MDRHAIVAQLLCCMPKRTAWYLAAGWNVTVNCKPVKVLQEYQWHGGYTSSLHWLYWFYVAEGC
jgi:hypothetical protein